MLSIPELFTTADPWHCSFILPLQALVLYSATVQMSCARTRFWLRLQLLTGELLARKDRDLVIETL
jgi:hypothetical protein